MGGWVGGQIDGWIHGDIYGQGPGTARPSGEETRDGIWAETAKIKGHVRGSMENYHSRNFLKHIPI